MKHDGDKIITFERAGLFWVFNFNTTQSFTDYRFGVSKPGKYNIVLDSDAEEFGGFKRITKYEGYLSEEFAIHGHPHSIQIYIPCRTALVFERVN